MVKKSTVEKLEAAQNKFECKWRWRCSYIGQRGFKEDYSKSERIDCEMDKQIAYNQEKYLQEYIQKAKYQAVLSFACTTIAHANL